MWINGQNNFRSNSLQVLSYEDVDCYHKLNETCLSPKEQLYSNLTNKNVDEDDCKNAWEIWKVF